MKNPRASLRTIAADLGLAVSTISRALNEHPRVPAELRARVQKAAVRLGYRKNPLVSALMREFRAGRGTTFRGTIGLLSPVPADQWSRPENEHYAGFAAAIRQRAEAHGFTVSAFAGGGQVSLRRVASILQARGIRGLVVLPMLGHTGTLLFPWDRFAAVKIGHTLEHPALHRVSHDFYSSTSRILEELLARGYRRIGMATDGAAEDGRAYLNLARFALYQSTLSPRNRVPLFLGGLGDPAALKAWVRRHAPDAVIGHDGRFARALRGAGFRLPADLGFAAIAAPPDEMEISGVHPPRAEIGAAAVDLLSNMLAQDEIGLPARQRTLAIHGEWHEGATLRAQA